MRALLVQDAPEPGPGRAANVARVLAALARHPDVDLAVFPELYLDGYDAATAATTATTAAVAVAEIAPVAARHRTAVVVGFAERLDDGTAANSVAVVAGSGELVAVYRKTQLFGAAEHETFVPGQEQVLTLVGGHRIAPLICFDVEFPEPARTVARAGAELLVTVAANMAPYAEDHRLAVRARALENRLPHLYVNRVGREAGHAFVGGTCVIDAGGRVVAEADPGDLDHVGETAFLVHDVPLAAPRDPDTDYLRLVREPLPVRPTAPAPGVPA